MILLTFLIAWSSPTREWTAKRESGGGHSGSWNFEKWSQWRRYDFDAVYKTMYWTFLHGLMWIFSKPHILLPMLVAFPKAEPPYTPSNPTGLRPICDHRNLCICLDFLSTDLWHCALQVIIKLVLESLLKSNLRCVDRQVVGNCIV